MDIDLKLVQQKFGQNLKKLRTDRGLTLMDLGGNCNLDDSFISKIENGKRNLQLSTIFVLANGLGVHHKELLDFDF